MIAAWIVAYFFVGIVGTIVTLRVADHRRYEVNGEDAGILFAMVAFWPLWVVIFGFGALIRLGLKR